MSTKFFYVNLKKPSYQPSSTMTEPSGRPSTARSLLTENLGNEDEMSDVTPSDARNVRRVHHKVVEKTVKYRFKSMDRNDEPIHPSALHIKWLHDVQEALGSDIEIYDNKGKVFEIASESCPFPAGLPSSVVSSVLRVGSRQLSPVRSRSTI
jgi:hypothetical protein